MKVLLEGQKTDGNVSIVDISYPQNETVPMHQHTKEAHFIDVRKGKFKFLIEDKTIFLNEGDSRYIGKYVWHSFMGLSDKNILRITIFPSGLEKLMAMDLSGWNDTELAGVYKEFGINFR